MYGFSGHHYGYPYCTVGTNVAPNLVRSVSTRIRGVRSTRANLGNSKSNNVKGKSKVVLVALAFILLAVVVSTQETTHHTQTSRRVHEDCYSKSSSSSSCRVVILVESFLRILPFSLFYFKIQLQLQLQHQHVYESTYDTPHCDGNVRRRIEI